MRQGSQSDETTKNPTAVGSCFQEESSDEPTERHLAHTKCQTASHEYQNHS